MTTLAEFFAHDFKFVVDTGASRNLIQLNFELYDGRNFRYFYPEFEQFRGSRHANVRSQVLKWVYNLLSIDFQVQQGPKFVYVRWFTTSGASQSKIVRVTAEDMRKPERVAMVAAQIEDFESSAVVEEDRQRLEL